MTMWFLLKASFWFGLVLVLLPIFDRDATGKLGAAPGVELTDAVSAAAGAYEYVSALCTEKPDVCEKGSETFTALGHRAREGARIAYELLDAKFGDGGTNPTAPTHEISVRSARDEDGLPMIDDQDVVTGTIAPLPAHKPQRP